jgi:nucleoside-diphosphate-sugar epimerase
VSSIDKAIEGATYVVHTASPFHFKTEKLEDLIAPAVDGTMNVIKACHKYKVKRVVVTSSVAAIWHGHDPQYPVYNETHWANLEFL